MEGSVQQSAYVQDVEFLIEAVMDGFLDQHVDSIADACYARQRALQEADRVRNRMALTPGTRVVIGGDISPKYMRGARGVVSEDQSSCGSKYIAIDLDRRVSARYPQIGLKIPANCLRELKSEGTRAES